MKTVLKCAACLGVLLASQMTRGQSCRPLEQKVFYQYDASHRIYPESAVVLETKHAPGGLSILISVARRIGGQWQQRILQSKDMGRHWVQVGAQDIPTPLALSGSNFAQAPSDPRVQYKYIERKKTYDRSQNGGATWIAPRNLIGTIRPHQFAQTTSGSNTYETEFALAAIDPSKPLVIFATIRLTATGTSAGDGRLPINAGLYRSSDGGEHWEKVTGDIEFGSPIGIDPSNPAVMYGYGMAGFLGVLKTTDGGATWKLTPEQHLMEQRPLLMAEQNSSKTLGVPTGLTVKQFAIDPSTNLVYIVSTKGIYRSDNHGDTWCLLNTGNDFLDSTYSLAFDPDNSSRIFLGTRFGVLYSADRGDTFTSIYPAKK